MSTPDRRIILAHGRNGELGVPLSAAHPNGLPWPRLPADAHFFQAKTDHNPLILGRTTYDLLKRYARFTDTDGMILRVTSQNDNNPQNCRSLADALDRASDSWPNKPVYIGGGAQLAAQAFTLLQMEGFGTFYETVVDGGYPMANVFMPLEYDPALWTEPDVLAYYESDIVTRHTANGTLSYGVTPAYTIQTRQVKQK